ncbi:MAG: aldehyde dehydrogenase family protein [Mycobacterium sp.]
MPEDYGLLIDGRRQAAQDHTTFPDISPVTGGTVAHIAAAAEPDGDRAVEAAARALPGWSGASFTHRRAVLLRAADLLEAERDEHRAMFALETGSTAQWADMNVGEAANTLREAAGLASAPIGTILPSHDPAALNLSERRPAGVVLAIVPWNAPLILAARSIAIALAVGNTVVIRPSELAPITAGFLLADVLHRAGLPAGVVNVVTCAPGGGQTLIESMIANPAVRRVVFIGSTPVGRSIARVAGEHLTPSVMELGGKNSTLVLADADLDAVAPMVAMASFANSGQVCMCTDRVLVHHSLADELAQQLSALASTLRVGDPRDRDTGLGPLINDGGVQNFVALVSDALARGGTAMTGGPERDDLYVTPTVLTGVPFDADITTRESFSPVVAIQPVSSDEHAIELANSTEFGLIASVLSTDPTRAQRVARQLNVGAVHINGPSVGDEPHVPFGGVGASGFGRLGGAESVHMFTEQKTLYLHDSR